MNKFMAMLFAVALAFVPSFTQAQGSGRFYENRSEDWYVVGNPKRGELNPTCTAAYLWRDGSEFNFVIDLVDGEMYIFFNNNQWNIGDRPGNYELGMDVYSGRSVRKLRATYELLSKNSIRIRHLFDQFVDIFAKSDQIVLRMPGNIQDAKIDLEGTQAATGQLGECIRAFRGR